MKKKIAIVCTTSTTIETFFMSHIQNLSKDYEITLISNFENSQLAKDAGKIQMSYFGKVTSLNKKSSSFLLLSKSNWY